MYVRWSNQISNVKAEYEKTVLRNVTCHHLQELIGDKHFAHAGGLVDSRRPNAKIAAAVQAKVRCGLFMVANEARISKYEKVAVTDFVLIRHGHGYMFGIIEQLFHEDQPAVLSNGPLAIVQQYALSAEATRYFMCAKVDALLLVQVGDIECSCVWAGGADEARVLKPEHMQVQSG